MSRKGAAQSSNQGPSWSLWRLPISGQLLCPPVSPQVEVPFWRFSPRYLDYIHSWGLGSPDIEFRSQVSYISFFRIFPLRSLVVKRKATETQTVSLGRNLGSGHRALRNSMRSAISTVPHYRCTAFGPPQSISTGASTPPRKISYLQGQNCGILSLLFLSSRVQWIQLFSPAATLLFWLISVHTMSPCVAPIPSWGLCAPSISLENFRFQSLGPGFWLSH